MTALDPELEAQFTEANRLLIEAERRAGANGAQRPELAAPEPPFAGLHIVTFDEARVELKAPYLVKGLLGAGELAIAYGESGSGKTFLIGHLAFCVATGREFFGRRVNHGLVLYVAAEAPKSFERRCVAMRSEFGANKAGLLVVESPLDLVHFVGDALAIVAACRELRRMYGVSVSLVVIDTIAAVMNGAPENTSEGMGPLITAMRTIRDSIIGCTVLGVHHTGKNKLAGSRGHSSLPAAIDTEFEITDRGDGTRALKVTKSRDGEAGLEIGFRLRQVALGRDAEGDNVTSCVVEPCEVTPASSPGGPRLDSRDALALSALWQAGKGGNVKAGAWVDACRKLGALKPDASDAAVRQTMRLVVRRLTDAGAIASTGTRGFYRPVAAKPTPESCEVS